jgi:hypothetical protein
MQSHRTMISDIRCGLPRAGGISSPTPAAAPPASPAAATLDEPQDKEQQYRADGGVDDCGDDPGSEMKAELRQQPASDKGAQDPDNEITNDPETAPAHDLTGQPAGNDTHKQYNQQAFTRHIHFVTLVFGFRPGICRCLQEFDQCPLSEVRDPLRQPLSRLSESSGHWQL